MKIPSFKRQIPNKFQFSNSKFQKQWKPLGLKFGFWNLFGIWNLELGIFLVFFLALISAPLFAATQTVFTDDIAPDLQAQWVVVDDFPAKQEKAQTSLKKACQHAREILDRLDPMNPQGETAALLSKKEKGTFPVSKDLAKILYAAKEIARQIKEPLARQIKIDLKENLVILKSSDVTINIEPVLKGYLADVIMEDLVNAGFQNSYLELEGGIFVARGQDFNGPWKVEVSDATTEFAHHTFLYKVSDTAAATVADMQKPLSLSASDIKSVTVFTKEGACKAEGLASAAYAMGLSAAEKFLKGADVERAVVLDTSGRFHQFGGTK